MVRILTKQLNNMQGYARYLRLAMNMGRYGQVPFPKWSAYQPTRAFYSGLFQQPPNIPKLAGELRGLETGNHEKTNITNSLVFFQQDHHLSPVHSSRPSPFWGKKDSPTVYAAMRSMDRMATNSVGMECIPSAVAAWWKHRFADFARYRKWKRKDSGRMLKNVSGLFELMLLYLWFWRFQGWPGLRDDSNMHASCNHPNFSTWAHHASSTQPTLSHPSQAVCRVPWNLRKISMSSCPEATQATHQSCPRYATSGHRQVVAEGLKDAHVEPLQFCEQKTARQLLSWYIID